MKTIIEVGASDGADTERLLDGDRNRVFSFEPLAISVAQLHTKFKDRENFYLSPMAVDVENGWRWFNTSNDIGGISSLYEIAPEARAQWRGVHFEHHGRYRVMTTRLDTFMAAHKIEYVDYLWIDAQGNDFRVLQSLGERIHDVVEGKCEAAYNVGLYAGVDNSHETIKTWLLERGFKVAVVPELGLKEADIHFRRAA